MPLKLNVGLSRKVGEQNYGSRGASVQLELELESALVTQPAKLQERIRELFTMVRSSLVEELNGNGTGPSKPASGNGPGAGPQSNPPRPATQSQVKAILAIAKRLRVNLAEAVQDRFRVGRPEDLTIQQASAFIDELKSSAGQGGVR